FVAYFDVAGDEREKKLAVRRHVEQLFDGPRPTRRGVILLRRQHGPAPANLEYNDARSLPVLESVKRSSINARPARASRCASPRSASSRSMAAASAAGSAGGTRMPVSSWRTASGIPPTFDATVGRSIRSASIVPPR